MGKVIFEYDSNEERNELLKHVGADQFYNCLADIDSKCRTALKHDDDITNKTERFLEELRDLITECGMRYID